MISKVLFLLRGALRRVSAKKTSVASLLAAIALAPAAQAVPYASGVINNAGTVSFILNESADNVTVLLDGGPGSLNLGALAAGSHSFALGAATTFEIQVSKSGVAPWTRISSDVNPLLLFSAGRGVAVNQNPASPYFGRIYVANTAAGTVTTNAVGGIAQSRTVGEGIYILSADQSDALGRGDAASTGGLAFDSTGGTAVPGANSPWRIEVGDDGNLYIADFSTNTGCIYYTDPDVNTGAQALAGTGWNRPTSQNTVHTTIGGSPIVRGSIAAGTLKIWSTDGSYNRPAGGSLNRLMRWDVDAGPFPHGLAPTQLGNPLLSANADVTTDCDLAPDGKFYLMQNRANGTETGLFVMDTNGTTVLWGSLATSRSISNNPSATDILRISRAVKVSPDGRRVALIRDDMQTWVLPLTNGIPDLGGRELVNTAGTNTTLGRDVSWDAAGNLYALSSGNALLRIFSPGGTTKTITRSDGTFTVVRPPPVSVETPDSFGHENGADTITFSIYRTGDTSADLTVNYTLTGTAINGTDYVTNTLSATILAGFTNVLVTLTPEDDSVAEPTETVVLTLVSGAAYDLSSPVAGTGYIADNETPHVTITAARAAIEESIPNYPAQFTITRLGETNLDIFVNVDLAPGSVIAEGGDVNFFSHSHQMEPGVTQVSFSVFLLPDATFEGNEDINMLIVPGVDPYTIGTPSNAVVTIRDDDYPTECVLFSDDFDVNSSANWVQLFGANNGIDDRTVLFADDYSLRGIPSAPHSAGGSTLGLFLQVNKNEPTAAGSAGVNLYPLMQSFSGNYALRFDLYLNFGGASTTEHALAGLNHSGNFTNRVTQSAGTATTAGGDGLFVAIETDASANREWTSYTYPTPASLPTQITNRTAASVAAQFPAPPYVFAGSPGNTNGHFNAWAYVEMAQSNGVISLQVNRHLLYSFTNNTAFTSGNVMVGMNDQFDSVGAIQNFAIIDNVRVVSLSPGATITDIDLVGGSQVQIDFNAPCATVGDLHLQSAPDLTPPIAWADDNSAVIIPNGGGFRATTAQNGAMRYYRIRR